MRRLIARQRMPTSPRFTADSLKEALEKLLQQIAGDMQPVTCAGTNVIDGSDFRFHRLPGFASQGRTPGLANQHLFRARSRSGVTAMLPMASRTSSILLSETLPSPARQSLAMACALRVPTLRE